MTEVLIREVDNTDYSAWKDLWERYVVFYDAELPDGRADRLWQRHDLGRVRDRQKVPFDGRVAPGSCAGERKCRLSLAVGSSQLRPSPGSGAPTRATRFPKAPVPDSIW